MSEQPEREIDARRSEEDGNEGTLRPQTLDDFTGQKASRENLAIFIAAARQRGDALGQPRPHAARAGEHGLVATADGHHQFGWRQHRQDGQRHLGPNALHGGEQAKP